MDRLKNQTNINAFITLIKAGLWEEETLFLDYEGVDYATVYNWAAEQSVQGLVLQGLEWYREHKPECISNLSQDLLLQWIGEVQMIEQQNKSMNEFVAKLIETLRKEDVYAILVKGQGIAQCYKRPLWRVCGDVDLLLSDTNYNKAKSFLAPKSSSTINELKKEKHVAYTIDGWSVELHGNLPSRLFDSIDEVIAKLEEDIFYGGNVKSLMLNNIVIFLPAPDVDVLFVFTHFLKHFFRGGVGLRQICDWCRLLWTYRDEIDVSLLGKRLRIMGLVGEWRTFAALAVEYLGMPVEAMPLYSPSAKWKRKASKVLQIIFETGNLGHKRDKSYYSKYPYLVWKTISFWNHTKDGFKIISIFPVDALKIWGIKFSEGFIELFQNEDKI